MSYYNSLSGVEYADNVALDGAGTFSGTTSVGAGSSLVLGNALALQDSTLDTDGMTSFGTLATVTLGGLEGSSNLSLPNASLTVGGDNDSGTFTGYLNGSGNLIKVGSGTLEFGGAINGVNETIVSGGNLEIDSTSALRNSILDVDGGVTFAPWLSSVSVGGLSGSGDLSLENGGGNSVTLSVGYSPFTDLNGVSEPGSPSTTYSGALSGSGSLTKTGSGTLTVTGAVSLTGTVTVSGGGLVFAGSDSNSDTMTVDGGSTLQFATPGSIPFYDSGTGTWSGLNITVESGATLAVNVGGASDFSTANVSTLLAYLDDGRISGTGMQSGSFIGFDTTNADSSGATLSCNITDATDGSDDDIPIGIAKLGTGKLTLTGTNSNNGVTWIESGVLQIGNVCTSGSLGSGNIIDSGELDFNGTYVVSNWISGSGSLGVAGGSLTLNQIEGYVNSFRGTTTVAADATLTLGYSSGARRQHSRCHQRRRLDQFPGQR